MSYMRERYINLFQSFFGGIKLKSVIGFDKIAEIVHKAEAPQEVSDYFIRFIQDIQFLPSQNS